MDNHLRTGGNVALGQELLRARQLARVAGEAAMKHYGRVRAEYKDAGSPVTEADHASNRIISAGLGETFPSDAILSEESRDSAERLDHERVWIVDPLDGTKEFLSQNGEFAIMIGLAIRGEAVLGVVYLPDGDIMYSAARGHGAWVERDASTSRLRCDPVGVRGLRLVGSRSHPDPLLVRIQESLGITDVRPCGSVGVKCALIAEGERDLYVHPVPYLNEWDTCAPEAMMREAGAFVTDCLGEPLRYNKRNPAQPNGIVVRGPGVADSVLERIAVIFAGAASAGATR